ncbi:peptidase M13 family [Perkinsela sp. CCAP 1560/4]|nr:peptidase M13 family [Perkinsela sp. CCAP 1560/4]|eukprot:KNH06294.1 peptidase M13 family [Perkinsela sp. CCAP 1560/4]
MFEDIHRYIVRRTTGERVCPVNEIYEHFSFHSDSTDYKVDEYTWPVLLKAYITDFDVKVMRQAPSETDPYTALLQICEANVPRNQKSHSASQFRSATSDFALSPTRAFLQNFLLFGGRPSSEEEVPLAHAIYAAGPKGIQAWQLAEELGIALQKVLFVLQSYLATYSIVMVVRDSLGIHFIHLKWMYRTAPFSLASHCINAVGDQVVHVKEENPDQGETRSEPKKKDQPFQPLRCVNGSRVWNSEFYRQTHVKHSFSHQIVSLHANFPNTAIVQKAVRFFVPARKPPKVPQLVYDLLRPFTTKVFAYKNIISANIVHVPHYSKKDYACRVVLRQDDDDENKGSRRSVKNTESQVDVIDVDLDGMPSNMCVRIFQRVNPETIVNAQGERFPIEQTTPHKWVANEFEPADVVEPNVVRMYRVGRSTHLLHEKSIVADSHVLKISRMNGYRLKLFDRVQILHEHITKVVFADIPRGRVNDTLIAVEDAESEEENDAYTKFLRVHTGQTTKNHDVSCGLQSILDEMPLEVFCAIFKGKWDFGGLLQGAVPAGVDALSNAAVQQITLSDALRFRLPKGLGSVRLLAVPELRAVTSTQWGVFPQLFLMLRLLHEMRCIYIIDWRSFTPQGSSKFLYKFPVRVDIRESGADDMVLLEHSLAEMWRGVRANWMKRENLRIHLRPIKRLDPLFLPVDTNQRADTQRMHRLKAEQAVAINAYRKASRSTRTTQFFTIPWWFNASYIKIVNQDLLAAPHFQNAILAVIPEVEKLFRKGSQLDAADVTRFFSSLDAICESDPIANPAESASFSVRSVTKKHYPSELMLFATFVTKTVHGKKLTHIIDAILQFEEDGSHKIDIFRLRPENEMHLAYVQSIFHAALLFYTSRGVLSIDLPRYIIQSLIFGILELFRCTGLSQRVIAEGATEEITRSISLRELCEELPDSHFKDFINSFRSSFDETSSKVHGCIPAATRVDWVGTPPTWGVSTRVQHKKRRTHAITMNIKFYESSYLSPHQAWSRLNRRGETAPPSVIVEIAKCLLNPSAVRSFDDESSPVIDIQKSVERMQWATKSLFSEIDLRLQGIESVKSTEIDQIYVQMSLRHGYEAMLRSDTIFPKIDLEEDLIAAPDVTESEKPAYLPRKTDGSSTDPEFYDLLWRTINGHFDEVIACAKAQSAAGNSEPMPSDGANITDKKTTTKACDHDMIDRVKAEILAHVIACPGSEETALYESIATNCVVSITLFRKVLEEMTKDNILEVECYRARSSRGSLYPLWLRAYSLAVLSH